MEVERLFRQEPMPGPRERFEAARDLHLVDELILDLALHDDKVSTGLVLNEESGNDWVTVVDATAGFAPLVRDGRGLVLRVDLPADHLVRQRRGLRILSWVVLPLNFLVVLLVFFFLRYLLQPFETLLAQARRVDEGEAGDEDEIAFLVGTFERAVSALATSERSAEDDIASLQRALSPSLDSGLLLLDRQARVLALNAMGCELLGVDEPPAEVRTSNDAV